MRAQASSLLQRRKKKLMLLADPEDDFEEFAPVDIFKLLVTKI